MTRGCCAFLRLVFSVHRALAYLFSLPQENRVQSRRRRSSGKTTGPAMNRMRGCIHTPTHTHTHTHMQGQHSLCSGVRARADGCLTVSPWLGSVLSSLPSSPHCLSSACLWLGELIWTLLVLYLNAPCWLLLMSSQCVLYFHRCHDVYF